MKEMGRVHRLGLSLLSAFLMIVAFPYTGSMVPLVFVAWVPLFLVESSLFEQKKRVGNMFLYSFLTFVIFNAFTTWWISHSQNTDGTRVYEVAALAYGANGLLMSLAFTLGAWVRRKLPTVATSAVLITFWLSFEWLHFHWELSWPWLTLGNYFSITPWWVQWYEYSGALGGSLWILLVNFAVFQLVRNRFIRKESWRIQTPIFIWLGFLLAFPTLWSVWKYNSYEPQGEPYKVAFVQPNLDPYNAKFDRSTYRNAGRKYDSIMSQLVEQGARTIVYPETFLPWGGYGLKVESLGDGDSDSLFTGFIRRQDVTILSGASTSAYFSTERSVASRPLRDGGFVELYNSAIMYSPTKRPEIYHKKHLVLGVETVPFQSWFPVMKEWAMENGGASGTLGRSDTLPIFGSGPMAAVPIICYESAYGGHIAEGVRAGGNLLTVMTNDGWWDETAGHKQHFSFSSLRAIENRRNVVRSANTGISGFFDQKGDVTYASKYWVEDAQVGDVLLNSELTFYSKYGDLIGRISAFLVCAFVLMWVVNFVKSLGRRTDPERKAKE